MGRFVSPTHQHFIAHASKYAANKAMSRVGYGLCKRNAGGVGFGEGASGTGTGGQKHKQAVRPSSACCHQHITTLTPCPTCHPLRLLAMTHLEANAGGQMRPCAAFCHQHITALTPCPTCRPLRLLLMTHLEANAGGQMRPWAAFCQQHITASNPCPSSHPWGPCACFSPHTP